MAPFKEKLVLCGAIWLLASCSLSPVAAVEPAFSDPRFVAPPPPRIADDIGQFPHRIVIIESQQESWLGNTDPDISADERWLHLPEAQGHPPWWSSVTGQYGFLHDDSDATQQAGGVGLNLSAQLWPSWIVQTGANFDFQRATTTIDTILGVSKLACLDGEHGFARTAFGIGGEYVTGGRPRGQSNWGLQCFAGYALCDQWEVGGKLDLGADRDVAPSIALDDLYYGYAAFYPNCTMALLGYVGGNDERQTTIGGLLAVKKVNDNVTLFVDLGGDSEDAFGISLGGQYFFGPGAPQYDGRSGLFHRFFGHGGLAPMAAYRTWLR